MELTLRVNIPDGVFKAAALIARSANYGFPLAVLVSAIVALHFPTSAASIHASTMSGLSFYFAICMIAGTIASYARGEVLGATWDQFWFPVNIALSLFLLAPVLDGGKSLAQYAVELPFWLFS
jgi:hypothetical protein